MKISTINGKQVSLLIALFFKAGIRSSTAQLEFLEFQCGIDVAKFEELNYGQLQLAINKLKKDYNLE